VATAAMIRAEQGNQVIIDLDPVWLGNRAYDLTGITLTAYVKASDLVPDDDPSVAVITATPGPNGVVAVTDAPNGLATLTINGSVIPDPGTLFWHIDATDGTGAVGTIAYGPLYVEETG
jgi:hypothetical protein